MSKISLGTPQKLIDSQGNVVWAAVYEAFGKARVDVNLVENHLRFAGQYFDGETGLHYNWHRYYEPTTGRYLRLDPISSVNLYAYVQGNPVNLVDPFGLKGRLPPIRPISEKDIESNVEAARNIWSAKEFKKRVQNKGIWDYKQGGSQFEEFGNYHFGLMAAATGMFSLETIIREAGRAQCLAKTSNPTFGTPDNVRPYGDDPRDQYWVIIGFEDYRLFYSYHDETLLNMRGVDNGLFSILLNGILKDEKGLIPMLAEIFSVSRNCSFLRPQCCSTPVQGKRKCW